MNLPLFQLILLEYKIIQEMVEIELVLNNNNTKFNKYKNDKKPPRIRIK